MAILEIHPKKLILIFIEVPILFDKLLSMDLRGNNPFVLGLFYAVKLYTGTLPADKHQEYLIDMLTSKDVITLVQTRDESVPGCEPWLAFKLMQLLVSLCEAHVTDFAPIIEACCEMEPTLAYPAYHRMCINWIHSEYNVLDYPSGKLLVETITTLHVSGCATCQKTGDVLPCLYQA
jgi:hypothetical protein